MSPEDIDCPNSFPDWSDYGSMTIYGQINWTYFLKPASLVPFQEFHHAWQNLSVDDSFKSVGSF
jgi:hypothetical protein